MRSDESGSLETSPGHAIDPTEEQRHSELLSRSGSSKGARVES